MEETITAEQTFTPQNSAQNSSHSESYTNWKLAVKVLENSALLLSTAEGLYYLQALVRRFSRFKVLDLELPVILGITACRECSKYSVEPIFSHHKTMVHGSQVIDELRGLF